MTEYNAAVTAANDDTIDLAASFNSDPIPMQFMDSLSVQINTTGGGSPTGTFKLQATNDVGTGANVAAGYSAVTGLSTWSDVPLTSQAVTTDGSILWFGNGLAYRWVRVVWTRTSGTGTLSGRYQTKGVSP